MNDMKIQSIGFLIFDGFPMACLTSMIEPLRAANEISGQDAFSWTLLAETEDKVRSSAGVSFEPDVTLADAPRPDYLILLSPPMGGFENSKSGYGISTKFGTAWHYARRYQWWNFSTGSFRSDGWAEGFCALVLRRGV